MAVGARKAGGAPAVSSNPLGANDTVRLGLIGCARGKHNLRCCLEAPNTEVVALCDVDSARLAGTLKEIGGKPDTYGDFRRIIDRQDIDAVIIATPDHWHAIPALQAIRAGKDVYLEKPIGHTIYEGQILVETARAHKRVVEVGLQQRSGTIFQEAVKLVNSGEIGKVSVVRCFNAWNQWVGGSGRSRGIGKPPDCDPPEGVDYDMWLGPAPKRPFNPNRFHWNYIYYWDYSGGMLMAWGVHLVDIALWAMKVKGPEAVTTSGGTYILTDSRETPDTAEAIFEFPDFTMIYSCRHATAFPMGSRRLDHGIQFFGSQATLLVDRSGYQIIPEGEKNPEPVLSPPELNSGEGVHQRRFIECVRSREAPVCDILEGHRSTTALQLANISYHTGRKIFWNAEKEQIINDADAARRIGKEYRAPWSLP